MPKQLKNEIKDSWKMGRYRKMTGQKRQDIQNPLNIEWTPNAQIVRN